MKNNGGGVIINAASYAGLHPSVGSGIYAAGKTAIISLTKSMAAEWVPYKIRVNCYSPGFVLTDMTARAYKKYGDAMTKDIALKRYGKPNEIADVVGFLCSEKASYITGENIQITGGKFLVQNQQSVYEKS
jgi:NAD(P)-dependent dehydrogenase (short-subunit alcohol dehydrogenase family)